MQDEEEEPYGYVNGENLCEREGDLLYNCYGVVKRWADTRRYAGTDADGDGLADPRSFT